jgi:carotenoid cleavage dioxygenase-like enzyme
MTEAMPDQRFLQGCYAPIDQEYVLNDLPVTGEIPRDLNGSFYRNGPNQQFPPRGEYHLFAGDGMTHAFHINDGKVSYRNRWIETAKFKLEREHQQAMIDPMNPFNSADGFMEFVLTDKDGLANTACVWHGGKFLVIEEGHPPFQVDPVSLASIGSYNYDGKLTTAMTAHPKLDPVTGEMVFFAYMASGAFESDVAVHKVNKDGVLTDTQFIPTPYPAMVHDFVVTENYILLPIFPLTGSLERAMEGKPPFCWEPEKGASIGILPREGGNASNIRWVECDPFFVFHFLNGFDKDGKITVDCCQFDSAPLFTDAQGNMLPDSTPYPTRWSIDMNDAAARVRTEKLHDCPSEFPLLDPRYAMRENRYGYYVSPIGEGGDMYNAVSRIDLQTNSVEQHSFGDRNSTFTSEAIFVPRSETAAEGEGYMLAVVTDMNSNTSALHILDAENVGGGPLAVAHLEHRIPVGFHGGWRPAS